MTSTKTSSFWISSFVLLRVSYPHVNLRVRLVIYAIILMEIFYFLFCLLIDFVIGELFKMEPVYLRTEKCRLN